MNMRRMRGRGNRNGGGNFRSPQTGIPLNRNHVFDSNGPEQRSRGTAQQLYDKYGIPPEATRAHIGGTQAVWTVGKDGKFKPVAVKVGITDYSYTEMREGDLKQGDALVTGQERAQNSQSQGTFPGNQRLGRRPR